MTTDDKLIADALADINERMKKFWEYHGVTENQLSEIEIERRKFIEKMSQPNPFGRSFYESPLARKAFVFGYLSGEKKLKQVQDELNKYFIRILDLEIENIKFRDALERITDKKYLRDVSKLASNPPQNAAVWEIQNIANKALKPED